MTKRILTQDLPNTNGLLNVKQGMAEKEPNDAAIGTRQEVHANDEETEQMTKAVAMMVELGENINNSEASL